MNDILPLCGTDHHAGPIIIAGPCSAETPHQILDTAMALSRHGIKIFRAGLWKPRTKPGGFEGVGSEGLQWMIRVKEQTGMLLATEVATPRHTLEALEAGIDILWLGARTSANPFAVQEIADVLASSHKDVGVIVKNPVSPDLELWIGAIERIYRSGVRRIAAVHRGFTSLDSAPYRNAPLWEVPVQLRMRYPQMEILCDPSHIAGRRDLLAPVAQRAADMGFAGLIIESHCTPDEAWSDAAQQITPDNLATLLSSLKWRSAYIATEHLDILRTRIDDCDQRLIEILAARMNISVEIGDYKRCQDMPVLQPDRFNNLLRSRLELGAKTGLSREFVTALFTLIHEESVRRQL